MATIYLLAKVDNAPNHEQVKALQARLVEHFEDKWRHIGNGSYLVAADSGSVTEDISNNAGITDGLAGGYIVTKIDPYYGWASNSVWEWIEANR